MENGRRRRGLGRRTPPKPPGNLRGLLIVDGALEGKRPCGLRGGETNGITWRAIGKKKNSGTGPFAKERGRSTPKRACQQVSDCSGGGKHSNKYHRAET